MLSTKAMCGRRTGTKISANLLSLGAIDFGIIADGAIVMTEAILRRREARPNEYLTVDDAREAAVQVARPILFATDFNELRRIANDVVSALQSVPGTADVLRSRRSACCRRRWQPVSAVTCSVASQRS
jgi:Cu/Ag efflux pump CusA